MKIEIQTTETAAHAPTRQTFELSRPRLYTFLQCVGTQPDIQKVFVAKLGWTEADEKEAWGLLHDVTLRVLDRGDNPVAAAVSECEKWQDSHLIVAKAALVLSFPEQAGFVFEHVVPGKGLEAVMALSIFLERTDDLQSGAERKSTRKADHAALACLERRGITKELLAKAKTTVKTARDAELPTTGNEETYLENLRKIHAWLQSWSEMARTVITRRDQLIRLGLAKRRTRKPKPVHPPVPPVGVPVPAPSPPATVPVNTTPANTTPPNMSNGILVGVRVGDTHAA